MNKKFHIYYVVGNHEIQSGTSTLICNWLTKHDVSVLNNKITTLKRKDQRIYICGIMDPYIIDVKSGKKHEKIRVQNFPTMIKTVTKNLQEEEFNICLVHRPENFLDYSRQNIDLILAGHAHGGQFRLPIIGSLIAPGQKFFPKYTSGPYYFKKLSMIVSRGLGNSTIPLRINNYPEIVYIQFNITP